jgi:ATP-dependent Lhr-like helicase
VLVQDEPVLYVERGGRGLVVLADADAHARTDAGSAYDPVHESLGALAEAVRSGRVPKLSLERIDGHPAVASPLAGSLVELGFQAGPRRFTLSA